jgi:hypothetical protein
MNQKSSRLFDPPPQQMRPVLLQIAEAAESALESGEYDSYEETLNYIRRICLRTIRLAEDWCPRCGHWCKVVGGRCIHCD